MKERKATPIRFSNGDTLKKAEEVVYLGGGLDRRMDVRKEVRKRISSVFPVLKSLELLWKHLSCSTKWKIQVFNAVCVSKVLYSLETLQYTDCVGRLLDTFQLKGFRKILQVPHTFIDRYWSKEKIFEKIIYAYSMCAIV